ncbi:hypothetical protein KKE14_03020 [Patescibacteria group bacterium]|nr:hypothetical protein [Patescibacteria group bacterium]
MDNNKKAVLVPIIFFKHYDWALSIRELRRYLWQAELSESQIEKVIESVPRLNYQAGRVWLGKDGSLLERTKLAQEFWCKVKRWRWIFSNVPFLSQVFVSNTLAFGAINNSSDIDLFLIGKSKRLWTMRAFLLVWFNLFNLRVQSTNRRAKFSPEFFVSETAIDLQPLLIDNDYYFSFWLADLVSIWSDNVVGKFWTDNNWNKHNLPIAWRSPNQQPLVPIKSSFFKMLCERVLVGKIGDKLEGWLKRTQEKIILRTNERLGVNPSIIMSDDIIKLHFNDRRAQIKEEIERMLHEFEEVKTKVW